MRRALAIVALRFAGWLDPENIRVDGRLRPGYRVRVLSYNRATPSGRETTSRMVFGNGGEGVAVEHGTGRA